MNGCNDMKTSLALVLLLSGLLLSWFTSAAELGNTFAYGGSLKDGGVPAHGTYEFRASLHSALAEGTTVAGPIYPGPAAVLEGRFSLELDFGPGVFTGEARWLEIAVRTNGAASDFTVLSPRQRLTPVPYALVAGSVPDGAITQGKLAAGAVTASSLAAGSVGAGQLAPGAAAANLASNGVSGVPTGGLILSVSETNAVLEGAGYAKIGMTQLGDTWRRFSDSTMGPVSSEAGSVVWTGEELIIWTGLEGWRYHRAEDIWRRISLTGAPSPRTGQTTVWTGNEMIVWGGSKSIGGELYANGGRYNPSTDRWTPISAENAPGPWDRPVSVWTGTELVLVGWTNDVVSGLRFLVAGKRYNPVVDRWTNMSTNGAPSARIDAQAVWTGSEMIIWGGAHPEEPVELGDGGRYNPDADMWLPVSNNGAPLRRLWHTAAWNGTEMIVWGGYVGLATTHGSALDSGAIYHPASDSWRPMAISGAPTGRFQHSAVVDSSGLIIWGGQGFDLVQPVNRNDGARYDFIANRWTPIAATSVSPGRKRHAAFWNVSGGEMLIWGGGVRGGLAFKPGDPFEWAAMSSVDAPVGREFQSTVWTGTEMMIWGGRSAPNVNLSGGARYNVVRDTWTSLPPVSLAPRYAQAGVWTGSEMIVWGGNGDGSVYGDGARYNPVSDSWRLVSSVNAPSPRGLSAMVWTGTEIILWGGNGVGEGVVGDGARYNPSTDTWRPIASSPLAARYGHSAVWTGSRMIVWGGVRSGTVFSDGAQYDPATDSWSSLPSAGSPSARDFHSAVWTGREMMVWGGYTESGFLNTGARYDPAENVWRPVAMAHAPSPRWNHTAVWTGSRILIWGGSRVAAHAPPSLDDGGIYDPVTDTWVEIPSGLLSARTGQSSAWTGSALLMWGGESPSGTRNDGARYQAAGGTWTRLPSGAPRAQAAAVWTGSEMLVWGGYSATESLGDGLGFAPAQNSWRPLPLDGAPTPREWASAEWTGTEMLIWGGQNVAGQSLADGAAYSPVTRRWRSLSTNGAPSGRWSHRAVWTGTEFLVWGGYDAARGYVGDGARYNPASDQWIPMSAAGAPSPRGWHIGVWTGTELLVWGGQSTSASPGDGARYDPSTDSWKPIAVAGAPSARANHAAVWTGTELLVWGGLRAGVALGDGARYDPVTDHWVPMSARHAPAARFDHPVLWTGDELVVWGGYANGYLGTGGSYRPATDLWKPISDAGAALPRYFHATVWTGAEMLIYGGAVDGSQAADCFSYAPGKTFFLYQRR